MRGKPYAGATLATSIRITPADAGKTLCRSLSPAEQKDHPRGCGENSTKRRPPLRCRGSPPRMRGKLAIRERTANRHRITPADAGKTLHNLTCFSALQDHPRGCGENKYKPYTNVLGLGSPPRMRGKQTHNRNEGILSRITPADAGKTKKHAF